MMTTIEGTKSEDTTIESPRIGISGMMTDSIIATERRRSRFGAICLTSIEVHFACTSQILPANFLAT
jgi:hypothetical protein